MHADNGADSVEQVSILRRISGSPGVNVRLGLKVRFKSLV
jgi:hypothetical protein